MKKIITFLLLFVLLTNLFSCHKRISAAAFMAEFCDAYPIEGVVYSPSRKSYEEGYIDEALFRKIYIYDGELPSDFAVFLNADTKKSAECGVFVCNDGEERARLIESCYERIGIVAEDGEKAFVICSGDAVFYSTLEDSERAKELFYNIIKKK